MDWCELEYARQSARMFEIALTESLSYLIQLLPVFEGQIRGPPLLSIDQFDLDFSDILPFMNQFGVVTSVHGFLLMRKRLTHQPSAQEKTMDSGNAIVYAMAPLFQLLPTNGLRLSRRRSSARDWRRRSSRAARGTG
jgi:hypothetical protein